MRYDTLPISLLLLTSLTNAAKFSMHRKSTTPSLYPRGSVSTRPNVFAASGGGSTDGITVNSVHDLIYLANITVGGTGYVVQLDTGSSDLWIKGLSSPLPNTSPSGLALNLTYGIGWANGSVSLAPVQFAGIEVPQQAFLDTTAAQNPALSYGANGIAGLGFTSLSTIDAYYNHSGSSNGRSLLYNAFAANTSEPNFISFALERNSDDDVDGLFTIGEVDPAYSDVLNAAQIPTFPPSSPKRWNVLLDTVLQLNGQSIPLTSTVAGAPGNKAVALLDSGTSYIYAPEAVCTAIYGGISGAQYDPSIEQWRVPCGVEIDVALQFNGVAYPMHPLDVSPSSLTDPSSCVGSFVPQAVAVGANQFDWLIGDAFLRSVYTIYDFGDFDSSGNMGNPYVKLLSLVDPNKASVEFHQARGGTANGGITYNAANVTGDASTTVQISQELTNTLDKIGTYVPIMLAIMGLNALVIILLLVAAAVYFFRRRSGRSKRRNVGRQSPRPFARRTTTFDMPPITEPHSYEPVSMALTEDTFVHPSPAFSKPGTYQPVSMAISEDTVFAPPSPAFSQKSPMMRPNSIA